MLLPPAPNPFSYSLECNIDKLLNKLQDLMSSWEVGLESCLCANTERHGHELQEGETWFTTWFTTRFTTRFPTWFATCFSRDNPNSLLSAPIAPPGIPASSLATENLRGTGWESNVCTLTFSSLLPPNWGSCPTEDGFLHSKTSFLETCRETAAVAQAMPRTPLFQKMRFWFLFNFVKKWQINVLILIKEKNNSSVGVNM